MYVCMYVRGVYGFAARQRAPTSALSRAALTFTLVVTCCRMCGAMGDMYTFILLERCWMLTVSWFSSQITRMSLNA